MTSPRTLFWFRRDLRLHDNVGLSAALREGGDVLPVFIFDTVILDAVEERDDPRLTFLHDELAVLKRQLEDWGSTLRVYHGNPVEVYARIRDEFPGLEAVYTNHDYEVYARKRDAEVEKRLKAQGIDFHSFKDQVIFEEREILSQTGKPMSVYTPYSRAWRKAFHPDLLDEHRVEAHREGFWQTGKRWALPTLEEMKFSRNDRVAIPSRNINPDTLRRYADRRDLPAVEGTTRLSVHLRFGTVSIREAFRAGMEHSDKWMSELIWRDFYSQLLANNPRIEQESFKPEYDTIVWRNNEHEFEAWCQGRTGYPLVDAGMRQLNTEHWMHNRVRMVVASFLTKHLLIDWRWGDAYFARKLLDYDLASNNGGWQWAAGSGADAAPYFRVFNPLLQLQKFDPQMAYVKKYVPEYNQLDYLQRPIVDHTFARNRALEVYGKAVKKA